MPDIGFWTKADDWVSWNAHIANPGTCQVSATNAAANGNAEFVVGAGGAGVACNQPEC